MTRKRKGVGRGTKIYGETNSVFVFSKVTLLYESCFNRWSVENYDRTNCNYGIQLYQWNFAGFLLKNFRCACKVVPYYPKTICICWFANGFQGYNSKNRLQGSTPSPMPEALWYENSGINATCDVTGNDSEKLQLHLITQWYIGRPFGSFHCNFSVIERNKSVQSSSNRTLNKLSGLWGINNCALPHWEC